MILFEIRASLHLLRNTIMETRTELITIVTNRDCLVRGFRGEAALLAFPNLFVTVTAAEWKFPRPHFLRPYVSAGYLYAAAYRFALHMHWP